MRDVTMAVALATLPVKSRLVDGADTAFPAAGTDPALAAPIDGFAAGVAAFLATFSTAGLLTLPAAGRTFLPTALLSFTAAAFGTTLLADVFAAVFFATTFFAGTLATVFFATGPLATAFFATALPAGILATAFFATAFFTTALAFFATTFFATALPAALLAALLLSGLAAGFFATTFFAVVAGFFAMIFFAATALPGAVRTDFAGVREGALAAAFTARPFATTAFGLPAALAVPFVALAAVELRVVFAISLHRFWPWRPGVIAHVPNTGKHASGILG